MKLDLVAPSPALSNHISAYFLNRIDYPLIEDVERADVGYLRFMLDGGGWYRFKNGEQGRGDGPHLLGPSTAIAQCTIEGPMRLFGAVLLPEFWGGLVDRDASECAHRVSDPAELFTGVADHHNALCALETIEEMAALTDAWLLRQIKPIPEEHGKVIDKICVWLGSAPIPSPQLLYRETGVSPRQVMRLANRHFGAPPRLLSRKFRALRTASRIVGTRGPVPDELADEYADKAHMNREIKAFTGMTPRQLQVNSNPILLATLHPDNFRADAPWT